VEKVEKIRNMDVTIKAPSSKAHTLRALVISSLAEGGSIIYSPLLGQDQLNVIECLKRLGVVIENKGDKIIVQGIGGKYAPICEELNVGQSGVGMNFLSSAACLSDKPVVLTGDKRITERPILEVISGLLQLGCKIEYLGKEGFPPVRIQGGGIKGGTANIKGAECSQYFSSIVIS
jgi:3-phosphoshikimate 1-carboxyvinyltransferase